MASTTETPQSLAEARFGRTVLLLMLAGFAAVLLAVGVAGIAMSRSQERANWISHTYQVERELAGIRLALEQMRSARRGALLNLSPTMRDQYVASTRLLDRSIQRVARLTADNPEQQANVGRLRESARALDALMSLSLSARSDRSPEVEARRQVASAAVVQMSDRMLEAERRLLATRESQRQGAVTWFYVTLVLTGVMLAAVAVGSLWVIRRYTLALMSSRDQLRKLNEGLEDAVRERTVDLQRANDEIQRFAYIVSHDLRSPLVNVMGFTAELEAATRTITTLIETVEAQAPEVLTVEAREAACEELPEAIAFIRTSTQKMDRLINAILRLSREGRRTMTPEALDMTAMAHAIAGSLQHRVLELGAEIRVDEPLPQIVCDRLAIEQILSNLVENAVKYLKPGRPGLIEIRGRRDGPRVTFEVADNGRGVDPRDHERIFDLFRRSGVQDQPGEGIGLAHVRALAYRIGGTIAIDSRLGEGATFRVNLPAVFAGEQGKLA
ncbi:sensor histidine kinase [Sphingomonas quercus]|uniref:sensor histidine kinase n=1 Tax=Sphingomonas quercus TaxID=2842451 RepID=UPI00342F7DC6